MAFHVPMMWSHFPTDITMELILAIDYNSAQIVHDVIVLRIVVAASSCNRGFIEASVYEVEIDNDEDDV